MWGRLVTCGGLQIGLLNIPVKFGNRPINIGRQDTILPYNNSHAVTGCGGPSTISFIAPPAGTIG